MKHIGNYISLARTWLLLTGCFAAAYIVPTLHAADVKGKVTEATDKTVRIAIPAGVRPKVGDAVEIYFEIPGIDESVRVGTGKVTEVGADFVIATISDSKAKLAKNQLARISSAAPANPGDATGKSSVSTTKDAGPTTARPGGGKVGEIRQFKGHEGIVWQAAFSPDGKKAVSASTDNKVRIWNVETGEVIRQFERGRAYCSVFSPDGKRILHGAEQTAILLDAQSGEVVRMFEEESELGTISSVAFSPDGRRILTGSFNGPARLWDAETGAEIRHYQPMDNNATPFGGSAPYACRRVAFSPDGRQAIFGAGLRLFVYDLETGRELRMLSGESTAADWAAFSPDGKRILAGGNYQFPIQIWDAASGQEVRRFVGYTGGAQAVAFSPDGRRILTGGLGEQSQEHPDRDYSLRLWNVETGKELQRFVGHTSAVKCVTFSPDGKTALSCGEDHTVRLWQLPE